MRIFRHGDFISPEIPSDWPELLGEPNLEPDMITKSQLEFDFMKRALEDMIQCRNGAEQYPEEIVKIIKIVRDVFSNSSEKLE